MVMQGWDMGLEFIVHNGHRKLTSLETTALKLALQKIFAGPVIGFTWNFHPKGQI